MINKLIYILLILAACNSKENIQPVKPVVEKEVLTQYGAPFNKIPEIEDIVMYQINLRSFSAEHNFQSVTNKLDYIKSLGANVIWLMPIYPVGQLNSAFGLGSPYSVKDYKGINSEFGDLEDLRNLVETAHSKGIAVILDWVANHTSWDNEWLSNKYWYTLDGSGNIISPEGTNWTDVADLNFDNSSMRKAMIEAMKYWVLEANIDGFRCDAVDFVPEDFWKQAINDLRNIENRELILLAEGGGSENFTSGFDMNYAWDFYTSIKYVFSANSDVSRIYNTHNAEYSVGSNVHKLRYITNHDIYAWDATPITDFQSAEGSLAAFVITSYLGGIPLIYAGQEVVQPDLISFFDYDPIDWSLNQSISESYKKIMQFRSTSNAAKRGGLTYYQNKDVAVFKRTLDTEEVVIITNVRNKAIEYIVADELKGNEMTNALTNENLVFGASLSLAPYEFMILSK